MGQGPNSKLRVITLQKKALRIINNQPSNSHSGPLFEKSNTLKFEDKILIGNIVFISKSINNLLPLISRNWFIFCPEIHNYDTVSLSTDNFFEPSYRTDSYGKSSIIMSAIICWNKTQNMLKGQPLKSLYLTNVKICLQKDASTNTNNLLKCKWKVILEQTHLNYFDINAQKYCNTLVTH